MYVRRYARAYVVGMHVCMHARVCVYVCVYARTCVCVCVRSGYACMYACTCVCVRSRYACMCECTCVCVCVYVVGMHVCYAWHA